MPEIEFCLTDKKCIPCTGEAPKLQDSEIKSYINKLEIGWFIDNEGYLSKNFKFINFSGVISFINRIAEKAENLGHHPKCNTDYSNCEIVIYTHEINGLTYIDFVLAALVDAEY